MCLKAVPGYSDASRVVVRSVVFSICIAGTQSDQDISPETNANLSRLHDRLAGAAGVLPRAAASARQGGGGARELLAGEEAHAASVAKAQAI